MQSYILQAFSELGLKNFSHHSDGDRVNFSCPICGDSKTNRLAARAWVYDEEYPVYHCYNCSEHGSAWKILKNLSESTYKKYNIESLFERRGSSIVDNVRYIKMIRLTNTSAKAEDYYKARKLPYSNNIAFCTLANVLKFTKSDYVIDGAEDIHCVAISWKNINGEVEMIQCRMIEGSRRYMFFKTNAATNKMLFNIENVSLDDVVYVTEGAFDALCVNNAVAAGSVGKFKTAIDVVRGINNQAHIVLVLDSDWKNNDIVKNIVSSLTRDREVSFGILKGGYKDAAEAYAASGIVEFEVIDPLTFKLRLVSSD